MKNGLSGNFDGSASLPVPLNLLTLRSLPPQFEVPTYDPAKVTVGIVHIGPSNFSRSHLGKMVHDVLEAKYSRGEPLDLGIRAISLKSANVKEDITPQDGLYVLTTKGAGMKPRHEVIGSFRDVMCVKDDRAKIIEAAADPNVKILTMTVTEKGYPSRDKAKADSAPAINIDNPESSTLGVILLSLKLRYDLGRDPPVVMSCDNLQHNGTILRHAVLEEASKIDAGLAIWIQDRVPFPSTMVDRITPSKSSAHVAEIVSNGVVDRSPVLAEPMPKCPLVIEDLSVDTKFPLAAEVFSKSGILQLGEFHNVIFTPKVDDYEKMKLRTLNGAHMALGCIGTVAGFKTSDEGMENPFVRGFVTEFMDEVTQSLHPIKGVDYEDFKSDIVHRLDNPDICDPLTRLARNGLSKLNVRILDTMRDLLAHDKSSERVSFAVAGWLHYAGRLDATGRLPGQKPTDEPNDTLAEKAEISQDINRNRATITALFDRETLWGHDLHKHSKFIERVEAHFNNIEKNGIEAALKSLVTPIFKVLEAPQSNPGPSLDYVAK